MALPAVLALFGKIVANPAVQVGATKLASDVYGRIMAPRKDAEGPAASNPTDPIIARLDAMATRDELIASFAALQAELDRRHQKAGLLLGAIIVTQAVVIALMLWR